MFFANFNEYLQLLLKITVKYGLKTIPVSKPSQLISLNYGSPTYDSTPNWYGNFYGLNQIKKLCFL